MVNETNKPQESLENERLIQRLSDSNQALASMQAEHRQLVEEMEQLRKRAEDLQRMRELQEREEEKKILEYQQNLASSTAILQSNEETGSSVQNTEEPNEEGNPEEADYIKEKLAEIARLKSQFKRVQHMINTTELIENHISANQPAKKQLELVTDSSETTANNIVKSEITSAVPIAGIPVTDPELIVLPNMPSTSDLNAAATPDEKEQLIQTMLNMFQDFSSDLKAQASNLISERERIKELKESIIRSRQEPPK